MRRLVIFFVISTLCHGFAVETPQNTVAAVGQAVSLRCGGANRYKVRTWSFIRPNATETNKENLYIHYEGNKPNKNCQRCNVAEDKNGLSVISFNASMMENGGQYRCGTERDGIESLYGAELIVLDTKSQCEVNTSDKTTSGVIMEGNYLEILCNFSFAGNVLPHISWIGNIHRNPISRRKADANGAQSFYFNTTFQLNASDNGMAFGYEINFTRSNVTESIRPRVNQATNVLSNVFRWNFTAVVWYMPRNIRIEPVKMIYNFGDRVECSADGNPSPNFTWSCDVGNVTREGSVLTLDADTFAADVNYTCQCTALSAIFSRNASENVIIRLAHETETVIIRIANETEWTSHTMLFIIVGVLAAVVLTIFTILIVFYFKGFFRSSAAVVLCFLCCPKINNPDVAQHHEDLSKTRE